RLRLGFGREFGGLLFGARLRLLGIRDLGYRLALGICVATATTAAAPPALARPFAGLVFLGTRRFVALTVLVLGRLLAARLAVLAIAPAAATAAPAPLAAAFAVGTLLVRFFLVLELEFVLGNRLVVVFFFDERGEAGDRGRPRAGAGDAHLGAFLLALGQHLDLDAVALFDLRKVGALGVEQVHRGLGRGVERDRRALALGCLVLDQPQRREAGARG